MNKSHSRRTLRLVAAGIGLVLGLVLAEAGARFAEARSPRATPPSPRLALFDPNPHGTGSYRLKPGLHLVARVEGRAIAVDTNAHRMRWREVEVAKAPGATRIAVLGDSFTFGCWSAAIGTSFVGRLDEALGPKVEVLNFGVGGYGFEDELLLLKEEVSRFAPDLILIATFNGNDVRDTFLGTARYAVKDGAVELAPEVLESLVPEPFRHAAHVNPRPRTPTGFLGALWHSAFARLALRSADRDPPFLEYEVSQRFTSYSFWSQAPYPKIATEAVDHAIRVLDDIRAETGRLGARVAVVAIPTAEQVYAIHPAGPGYDIGLPQARIRDWAADRGVAFLDLLPTLREAARSSGRRPYLRRDVHFNDYGHQIAAEAILPWLRAEADAP